MNYLKNHILVFVLFGLCISTNAQTILIDQGVNADGLWCFPIHKKENTYLYLPQRARLSLNNDSIPEFSFLRYVLEKPSENTTNTITEAGGGGILNFLVLYDTPKELISNAERFLKKKLENDEIILRGPIIFDSGKYTLVSSILNPSSGTSKKEILGTGVAPIIENSKIPLSFDIDPVKSKLLLESFKMSTPDVSLVFELGFSGLTESYEAELEIDWSEVKKSHAFDAGGSIYFVGADVGLGFDKLRKDNAIKFTSTGSDESMESLVQTVYNKLLELMFKPTPLEQVPEEHRGGLEDAISSMISPDGMMGSRNTTGFGINVGYQYKEHKTTGKSNMVFKGRSTVNRNHYITFNAGNLYKKYGDNKEIFKDVPLWDPAFQQRDVYVGVDGNIEKEFDKMLNSVTVKLNKQHQNGDNTLKEVLLTKDTYKSSNGKIAMKYLNHEDADKNEWLNYQYKTTWKFIGGGTFNEEWKTESASMINLYTPFQRRRIDLSGDLKVFQENNIRAVAVKINYDFFGDPKSKHLTLYPTDNISDKFFEITLPKGKDDVDYTITWYVKNDAPIQKKGVDQYGLIFIDEIPN
ncbi:hypothetical protein [Aquimarina sp. 2201CG5-10]|uniref:hypothetical protein n=1 Tax=Aquimarina callyspongiae TaxID=3098150 RepID=UPI002AB4EBB7|nr:hypothetical protein [Aquimarina sp. 2201CG5-10]MDY8138112.1 hypothetical protein [Aquimarina sp. 2201CG5-10]